MTKDLDIFASEEELDEILEDEDKDEDEDVGNFSPYGNLNPQNEVDPQDETDHFLNDPNDTEIGSLDEEMFIKSNDTDELPTTTTTGLQGVLDAKKQAQVAARQRQKATNYLFVKWFEIYLNAIYRSFYTETGSVSIKPGHEGGFINMDSNQMTLYEKYIIDLWDSGVPPLLVFYHEIGHLLFTTQDIISVGHSLHQDVFHLLNWIEDFYIEERLMKELYYVKPYIKMLHEVVPEFIDDWQKPEFAFNYYYAFEGQIPLWMNQTTPAIGQTFDNYIKRLLNLRRNITSKFAQQRFVNELTNFYQFCVTHKILTPSTPPPPTQPQPQVTQGGGAGMPGASGAGSGRGQGGQGSGNDLAFDGSGSSNTLGQDILDPNNYDPNYKPTPVHTVYKPLDPVKGFDKTLIDLMLSLQSELDKQLFNDFKFQRRGKLALVQRTKNTTSPRNLIDPIAIVTNREDIYLEYITEEQNYVGYNLFIDASGSVGFNMDYNHGVKKIIDIIEQYPHTIYSFNDTLVKWTPKEISKVLQLRGTGGTESSLIAPVVLEKREELNLNIIFSDGDLTYLTSLNDFDKVKDKYLFVFFCVDDVKHYTQSLSKYLDPKQFYVYNKIVDIDKGLDALKKYIKTKGA